MVGARDGYMFKTYHVKIFENQVKFVEEMPWKLREAVKNVLADFFR